ncbi:sialate:O-sulfotransferase 2-like [Watersipora subatra]|uniref:sialate:O-sulfotransferase 2-like n=1 Tax=Watersipora subatra TaxID=2589382 RepID=UPI00355B42B4
MFKHSLVVCIILASHQICEGIRYQGCYIYEGFDSDPQEVTDLEDANSVEACVDLCTYKAYKYAGLQGNQCYCGDSLEKYCQVKDDQCNIECSGERQQSCGGANRNSFYSTNYLGCWRDSSSRDLRNLKTFAGVNATLENCVDYCRDQGYKYAGAQYFSQCFCDNRFGMYPELNRYSCATPCDGNSQQMCGGGWANSVFNTQIDCGCHQP